MKLRAAVLGVTLLAGVTAGAQQHLPVHEQAVTSDARLDRIIRVDLKRVPLADAVEQVARAGQVRISFSRESLGGAKPVTMRYRAISVGAALAELLESTDIGITVVESGLVVLVPRPSSRSVKIRGRVIDAASGAPLYGAGVLLDGKRVADTDAAGMFNATLRESPNGRAFVVKRIGYVAKAIVASVDTGDLAIELSLEPTPVTIDRVVVMAPADALPERSITSAITVIGAADLERQQFGRLEDVLRFNVPGLIIWNEGPSSPTARFGSIRGASSFAINYLKAYIDGVEVAAPYLALNLDPRTIEKVEIIRGPQGAALYGSDAINGVLQIVTRHGGGSSAVPFRASLEAGAGRLESRFVSSTPLVNEYAASAGGQSEAASFYIGGSGSHVAEYAPGDHADARSLFAAVRLAAGSFSAEGSARGATKKGGTGISPIFREHSLPVHAPAGADEHIVDAFYGMALRFSPLSWVTARTSIGLDRSDLSAIADPLPFANPADSFLVASSGLTQRSSLRVALEFQPATQRGFAPTLTVGADGSRMKIDPANAVSKNAIPPGKQTTNGIFAQSTLGFGDSFFLNGGLRGERSSAFGSDFGTAWLPLVGATVVHDGRPVTVKLRGSYGKGIRPPAAGAADAFTGGEIRQVPNPQLAPESQRGIEGGIDLYFARVGDLHVTAYRQNAYDLVQQVIINAASRPRLVQQQNVGTISNKGWEAEAGIRIGPAALTAGATRTASRVTAIAKRYSGFFLPGDRVLEVPAWTSSVGASFAGSRVSGAASFVHIGDWIDYDWISMYRAALGREPKKGTQRDYWITYPGFNVLRVAGSIRLWQRSEFYFRGENLTNDQRSGRDNLHIAPGRTLVAGVRVGRN